MSDPWLPARTSSGHDLADLAAASEELEMLRRQGDSIEEAARSANTKRLYATAWNQFEAWCAKHGLVPLPADPETVRLYATDLAIQFLPSGEPRYKVASIRAHLSAISRTHYDHGHGRDLIRTEGISNLMAGLARTRLEKPSRRRPLLVDDLRNLIAAMDHTTWPAGVQSTRDTFCLLFGFASALRRSEQAALLVGDVVLAPLDGLHIRLGQTKTDQEGQGVTLGVPYGQHPLTCPVCAYVRWLRILDAWDNRGRSAAMREVFETPEPAEWTHVCRGAVPDLPADQPLLRRVSKSGAIGEPTAPALTGDALYDMLKRRLVEAGYDPSPYGWHSLRSGFVTQARRNGADTRSVRRQTRHSSDGMVDTYDREHLPLKDNAANVLGL